MLIDHLQFASEYYSTSPNLAKALQWLEQHRHQLANMENGRYEIAGEEVYAIINSYNTKPTVAAGKRIKYTATYITA